MTWRVLCEGWVMFKSRVFAVASLTALVLTLAICGGTAAAASRQTNTASQAKTAQATVCDTGKVHFAKTKFVFHMGLAFGAFHRYIYKPIAAGAFNPGQPGRVKAGVKAALAAAFIWHELKIACKDANNSSVLKPLLTPISLLVDQFTALEQKLKGGSFSLTDLTSAGAAVNALGAKSKSLGVSIHQIFGGFKGG